MGTIFVAYGEEEHRSAVLSFAAQQADPCGHDLRVFHVQESSTASNQELREEVATVIERTAPTVDYEVVIESVSDYSDLTNVSKQKRLTDALLAPERDFEYVVMGKVEHGSIEEFSHGSMTNAVLTTQRVPVLLVPV